VFQRGPDQIPRGNGTLMLRVISNDKRQTIYDQVRHDRRLSRGRRRGDCRRFIDPMRNLGVDAQKRWGL
jgi:hypothetical protein